MDILKECECKNILFHMWFRVEIEQFDSRSFVGDTALDLRDVLFKDENSFWAEYEAWKIKYNHNKLSNRTDAG